MTGNWPRSCWKRVRKGRSVSSVRLSRSRWGIHTACCPYARLCLGDARSVRPLFPPGRFTIKHPRPALHFRPGYDLGIKGTNCRLTRSPAVDEPAKKDAPAHRKSFSYALCEEVSQSRAQGVKECQVPNIRRLPRVLFCENQPRSKHNISWLRI